MSKVLALRPRPEPTEDFRGYLLRLAHLTGWETDKSLVKSLGIPYQNGFLKPCTDYFNKFIKTLAPALQIEPEELAAPFRGVSLNFQATKTKLKEIQGLHLKLCTSCMKEKTPFIRNDWKHIHITHCEKHECSLIDECPNCHTPLKWEADSFEGCTACGTLWTDISGGNFEPVPAYQIALIDDCKLVTRENLQQLYIAAASLLFPGNFCILSYKKLHIDLNTSKRIFALAYQVVTSPKFKKAVIARTINKLTSEMKFFTYKQMTELCQHPISRVNNCIATNSDCTLDFSGLEVNNTATINEKQAMALTALDTPTIKSFVLLGWFEKADTSLPNRLHLPSLDKVMKYLHDYSAQFEPPKDKDKTVTLAELTNALPLFFTKLPLVLGYFIKNELPIWRSSATSLLGELYIERDTLVREANQANLPTLDLPLSFEELSLSFGTDRGKLKKVAELYHWEEVQHSQSQTFSMQSIMRFTKKHALIEQWCKVKFYPLGEVVRYLKSVGVPTVCHEHERNYNLYIYERSEALSQALEDFEDFWLTTSNKPLLKDRMLKYSPVFYSDKIKAFLAK